MINGYELLVCDLDKEEKREEIETKIIEILKEYNLSLSQALSVFNGVTQKIQLFNKITL